MGLEQTVDNRSVPYRVFLLSGMTDTEQFPLQYRGIKKGIEKNSKKY